MVLLNQGFTMVIVCGMFLGRRRLWDGMGWVGVRGWNGMGYLVR